MNTRANDICKIAKNVFGKHMNCTGLPISTLLWVDFYSYNNFFCGVDFNYDNCFPSFHTQCISMLEKGCGLENVPAS
jgi:hypothetical protein